MDGTRVQWRTSSSWTPCGDQTCGSHWAGNENQCFFNFGFLGATVKDLLKLSFLPRTSHFYSSDTFFTAFSSPPTSRSNISLSHCGTCAPSYTISLIPPTCFPNVSFHLKQVHLPPTCTKIGRFPYILVTGIQVGTLFPRQSYLEKW